MNFWGGGHWCKKIGSDSIYGKSLKSTSLFDDMGIQHGQLELRCLRVEMIMVVRDGETSKRNSWTWKYILGEGTLE